MKQAVTVEHLKTIADSILAKEKHKLADIDTDEFEDVYEYEGNEYIIGFNRGSVTSDWKVSNVVIAPTSDEIKEMRLMAQQQMMKRTDANQTTVRIFFNENEFEAELVDDEVGSRFAYFSQLVKYQQ